MSLARLRAIGSLAVGAVPAAVFVHLMAEALSLGREALSVAFVTRHIYLGVVLCITGICFGRTVGVGCRVAERRRRCALIQAQLCGGTTGRNVATLSIANLVFFLITQLIEGLPIASGDWCLGLVAALLGSLIAAWFVFFFGRSVVVAALFAMGVLLRGEGATPKRTAILLAVAPRRAQAVFSLFVPNRPPPTPLLV
jgi:hypothetical protein